MRCTEAICGGSALISIGTICFIIYAGIAMDGLSMTRGLCTNRYLENRGSMILYEETITEFSGKLVGKFNKTGTWYNDFETTRECLYTTNGSNTSLGMFIFGAVLIATIIALCLFMIIMGCYVVSDELTKQKKH